MEYDQWIVHQRFDPYRPFYRVRLNDDATTDLYVSARTGEVLQRTRFSERAWNWSGAVIHWIYFTPLRKSYCGVESSRLVGVAGGAVVQRGRDLARIPAAGEQSGGRVEKVCRHSAVGCAGIMSSVYSRASSW